MAITDKALAGKVALVTGASQGIGRAIAIALGRRGAKVVVNFLPDANGSTREQDARKVAAAIKAIGAEHKQLDIVVNNAGIAINGLIMRFTDEQWTKTLAVNLNGA